MLDKEIQRIQDADPNSWLRQSKEERNAQEKTDKAWNEADRASLNALGESALQEVLDATGKQFTNPLKVYETHNAYAYSQSTWKTSWSASSKEENR